jgi:peptide deformylase
MVQNKKSKRIWTLARREEARLLRQKTQPFDFSAFSRKDASELVRHMKMMMVRRNGIGLAANQLGIPLRVFVAQLPRTGEKGYAEPFYAIFNPRITHRSFRKIIDDEGCLSVPGMWGTVKRSRTLTLKGFDQNGKPLMIKAQGLLARIFQHEVDHLDGRLFTDRTKKLFIVQRTK